MDGGGSPLPSTGLAAGSFLMTGSRAGSSLDWMPSSSEADSPLDWPASDA